ncbi:SRPBCC family protein [Leptolyngbya sp. AN03gr2]|uniref:SRPBCC family protein n=1 Tax=unclassified Leptolyngbya TaxID=2650499 RepID=UPI003D3118D4
MSQWLEHTAQVEVEASIEKVWGFWSDLEQMPNWMNWISSVKVSEEQPELSRWTLNAVGLQFSWQSRLTKIVPNQIIQWESISGLPNRGAIRFYDRGSEGSIVKMTIAYSVPELLAQMMNNGMVDRFVQSNIRADLDRFREYAVKSDQAV